MEKTTFDMSIRCYYPSGEPTSHYQKLKLTDIQKWIKAYQFTHPNCQAITVKIWLTDMDITT